MFPLSTLDASGLEQATKDIANNPININLILLLNFIIIIPSKMGYFNNIIQYNACDILYKTVF